MIDLDAIVASVTDKQGDDDSQYASDRDRKQALVRKPWWDRNLAVMEGLRAGDQVRVSVIATSYAPYDYDPGKAPRSERVYVLENDPRWQVDYTDFWGKPGRQLIADVKPAPGASKRVKPGTLMVRTYNLSTLVVNHARRDQSGSGTTGAWVHIEAVAPAFDLDAIIASVVPQLDLDGLIAKVKAQRDPSPSYRHRGTPQAQLYRLRLSPPEHRALLCLVVAGIELKAQPLTRAVCACLGATAPQTLAQRQRVMKQARDRGLLDMTRIGGTSDMDVTLDARLLGPLRKAADQALSSPPCVNPRYRPLEAHLNALSEALSPRGLAQRQYHGES